MIYKAVLFISLILIAATARAQTTGTLTLESACSGSSCTTGPSCATYTSGVLTGFVSGACGGGTSTATVWNVIVPTGTATTDTGNINTALATCTNTNAIFLAETGTHLFEINATIDLTAGGGHDGCTIAGSIGGTPYGASNGVQNTVVDCSGLSGATPCFKLSNSDVLTGFAILGNGSTAGTNTVCVDNETANTGGNTLNHMVMRSCGYGFNEGSSTGTVQNDRLTDVTFANVGTPVWCHGAGGCTGNYMTAMTMLSPTVGILCDAGCTNSQFTALMAQALGGTGVAVKLLNGSRGNVINNLLADQGSCVQLNGTSGLTLSAVRCAGNAGASNYCLDFESNASTAVSLVAVICSTGYNGSGSGIFNEGGGLTAGCVNCSLDVSWNHTDQLYTGTQAETDFDWQRFTHSIGYSPVTLTLTTFAAPDVQNGFNQSFAISSACSTPCTVPAPVGIHNGEHGYFAFTQPATAIASPLTWNGIYVNSAQPFNGNAKTTWFPWLYSAGSIILEPSFHN